MKISKAKILIYLAISSIICVGLFILTLLGLVLVYPNAYDNIIRYECANYGIDYQMTKAIIWTESKYRPNATSRVGAIGLMQILPKTAEWLSNIEGIEFRDLKDPKTNIKFGVIYLKYLQKKFDSTNTVLAAYNAGEGNVSLWLRDSRYSVDGKIIDKTPFKETNDYIAKVNRTQKIYKFLYY